MEIIRGKQTSFINTLAYSDTVHIDIGTGDGRFVMHIAQTQPETRVIGVDSCRENLREVSRRAPDNALFVIANALALPRELHGLATHVTINFPWGSLLEGLVNHDAALLDGLLAMARPRAVLEVRLNGGALAEAGWSLEDGAFRVWDALSGSGFRMAAPRSLTASDLRACPTTWAKRLAYGRDPRAVYLRGVNQ